MTQPALESAPVPAAGHLTRPDADPLFGVACTAYDLTDEPVTDTELRAVHELAQWAPTAVNGQPLRVAVVRGGAERQRLQACLPEGNRGQTATAPLTLVMAADLDFDRRLAPLHPRGELHHRHLAADDAARIAMARTSATIQAAFVIQAVRATGLSAGPMGAEVAADLRPEFSSGGDHEILMVVNVGHPTAMAFQDRDVRLPFAGGLPGRVRPPADRGCGEGVSLDLRLDGCPGACSQGPDALPGSRLHHGGWSLESRRILSRCLRA